MFKLDNLSEWKDICGNEKTKALSETKLGDPLQALSVFEKYDRNELTIFTECKRGASHHGLGLLRDQDQHANHVWAKQVELEGPRETRGNDGCGNLLPQRFSSLQVWRVLQGWGPVLLPSAGVEQGATARSGEVLRTILQLTAGNTQMK